MMKHGDAPVVQLKVQWGTGDSTPTTWEDYDVLRHRFPSAPLWAEADNEDDTEKEEDTS